MVPDHLATKHRKGVILLKLTRGPNDLGGIGWHVADTSAGSHASEQPGSPIAASEKASFQRVRLSAHFALETA